MEYKPHSVKNSESRMESNKQSPCSSCFDYTSDMSPSTQVTSPNGKPGMKGDSMSKGHGQSY